MSQGWPATDFRNDGRGSAPAAGPIPAARACIATVCGLLLPLSLHRPLDQQVLDTADGARWIEPFWTDVDAIHDGMATEKAVRIFEIIEPLIRGLITAVGKKTISLQQTGRPHKLVGIPPEGRAGGGAAGAQDALVQPIQSFTLRG